MSETAKPSKSAVEQSAESAEHSAATAPIAEKTAPPKWVSYLVLTGLAIYAVCLSLLALDETFDFGWFPTVLEKKVRMQIAQLTSADPQQREQVRQAIVEGEKFVVVPELVRKLDDPSPEMRRVAYQVLKEVTPAQLPSPMPVYNPDASADEQKKQQRQFWNWWKAVQNEVY